MNADRTILPSLSLASLLCFAALDLSSALPVPAQHVPEANRVSGNERLRGITGFAVSVSVKRKKRDLEDTEADARIKASIEKTLRAAGYTIYTDDDNFPVLYLQVIWDNEYTTGGTLLGQTYAEVLSVYRILPAPKENNPVGKPYISAAVWYAFYEDATSQFDLPGAFIEGAGYLTDALLSALHSLPTAHR